MGGLSSKRVRKVKNTRHTHSKRGHDPQGLLRFFNIALRGKEFAMRRRTLKALAYFAGLVLLGCGGGGGDAPPSTPPAQQAVEPAQPVSPAPPPGSGPMPVVVPPATKVAYVLSNREPPIRVTGGACNDLVVSVAVNATSHNGSNYPLGNFAMHSEPLPSGLYPVMGDNWTNGYQKLVLDVSTNVLKDYTGTDPYPAVNDSGWVNSSLASEVKLDMGLYTLYLKNDLHFLYCRDGTTTEKQVFESAGTSLKAFVVGEVPR